MRTKYLIFSHFMVFCPQNADIYLVFYVKCQAEFEQLGLFSCPGCYQKACTHYQVDRGDSSS